MTATTTATSSLGSLQDLVRIVRAAEGFSAVADALRAGRSATVDGAWGSSGALAAAALGNHAPGTLLVALAHPIEVDGWSGDLTGFAGLQPAVFSAWDALPAEDTLADEILGQRLRLLKHLEGDTPPRFVLATIQALMQPVPDRQELARRRRTLRAGDPIVPDELAAWLVDRGFRRTDAVEVPGEFSRRGGILDVFPLDAEAPFRLEFFGDEIESIRQFSIQTQRSIGDARTLEIVGAHSPVAYAPGSPYAPGAPLSPVAHAPGSPITPGAPCASGTPMETGHFCDYLPADSWTVLVEPDELTEQGKHYLERVEDAQGLFSVEGVFRQLLRFPSIRISALPFTSTETTCHLRIESVERFSGDIHKLRAELASIAAGDRVIVACHNEAEQHRLGTVLREDEEAASPPNPPDIGGEPAAPSPLTGRAGVESETNTPPTPPDIGGEPSAPPSSSHTSGDAKLSTLDARRSTPTARLSALDSQRSTPAARLSTPTTRLSTPGSGLLSPSVSLALGRIRAGFRMVEAGIIVLGDHELFHREDVRQVLPRRRLESRAIDSFLELTEGDLVVHVSHGIARYRGMKVLERNGQTEEHLMLDFREGTRVYVPASKIDLVQKYVGGARTDPELAKLGGCAWQRKKDKVQAAVQDLASDMIELQALRAGQAGIACPKDSDWQAEFEATFPYKETPDQLTTLAEIKQDMERTRPMDRLVCGDVGYGKTELAVRASFKTIDNGKQVAVLVPTTVLAEQHFRTFSQRLAEYPFVVETLSRFRSHGEQRRILERLANGGIDVIIGTHRLVSADVRFKDLGLVVIDEEQRFGVEHKERLKRLRQTVDVLTLTATPIPRTLHLSLLGIRDISNLETPPPDRLAIETRIVRFDAQLIRHAILRELNREGQVYFVHNRVYNIDQVTKKLQSIVPEARITIAHGQMPEGELEQAMVRFVRRESDILVSTTIIESGLDIPNVNTIFIDQADMYGLADLHQLRGRVGRYKHRAYAYLLLDGERGVTPTAARRLKALEEFTELGAGFKIALRDLEIRGAGNILGTQQSGHIAAVGYEMYCQLLENAVRRLKHQPLRTHLDVDIDLPFSAYLPRDYIPGQKPRIEVYRRLARIRRTERLEDFRQELRDRFGPPPEPVDWLLRVALLRILAARWQIAAVHLVSKGSQRDLELGYRGPRHIKRLAARAGARLRIIDDACAFYRLQPAETDPLALFACLKDLLRFPTRSL